APPTHLEWAGAVNAPGRLRDSPWSFRNPHRWKIHRNSLTALRAVGDATYATNDCVPVGAWASGGHEVRGTSPRSHVSSRAGVRESHSSVSHQSPQIWLQLGSVIINASCCTRFIADN